MTVYEERGMLAYICRLGTWQAEAGGSYIVGSHDTMSK